MREDELDNSAKPTENPLPGWLEEDIYDLDLSDWQYENRPGLPRDWPPVEGVEEIEEYDGGGGGTWKAIRDTVVEVAETVVMTLLIFFLLQLVVRNFKVVGDSMIPNLHDGQFLVIDKLSYRFGGPKEGDVIVFRPPGLPPGDKENYVKRVIALPGQTVEVKSGQVYVDGKLLLEPYMPRTGSYSMSPRQIDEGEVFALGDNRDNSNDSHNWGTLPQENIVGRAWICYWPPEMWGLIPRDAPTSARTLVALVERLTH